MSLKLAVLAFMLAASLLATAAAATAGWGRPEAGVIVTRDSRVASVLPGGPSWRDGIRPGQSVLGLTAGLPSHTWQLVTSDGERSFSTSYVGHEMVLRDTLPGAVLGMFLAAASWILIRRPQLAAAVAAVSVVLSGQAFTASGYDVLTALTALLAVLGPAAWLTTWGFSSAVRNLGVVSAAFVAAAWLGARYVEPAFFDTAEVGRQGAMAAGLGGIAISLANLRRWRGRLLSLESGRAADLLALVVVIAIAVFVGLLLEFPLALLAVSAGAVLLLYPRFRRRLAGAMDQVLVGDIRARASLEAVEEERGRIARDLHDEPLQEIAAVIRQLDDRPDTAEQAQILRQVADHLRRVTTELRPPVLDDLGLPAALAYVAEQAASAAPGIVFRTEISPDDLFAERPPPEVELAVFRIVQEAVDNAVRHAGASVIALDARVAADDVTATVTDDGRGIPEDASRQALRAGHLGLATMAQRAALIGAVFHVRRSRQPGTEMRVEWRAAT